MKAVSLLMRALIRGYQLLVSPFFPPCCRFFPSCSDYAGQAVTLHGPVKGLWLALRRICRCHPWGGLGYDPVPGSEKKNEEKFTAGLGLSPKCRHLNHQPGR